ncbi:MAG: ABC transporter ATP-binding protein [Acidobacteria bacterium]|nr:ABC transporter ATP-binding protein [Acidobacteriota bacterium]
MSLPLVRVENLRKVFPSGSAEIVVLDRANFEIHAGESIALVGESGAGKTTLLYMLGALDEPTSGEIYFDSKPLSKRSEKELATFRNGSIGYVWQNYHLLPEFSAIENVMMPLLIANHDRTAAEAAALKWLANVGLADRASHQAGELSGGEQQRVALARSLVSSPRLLLADEPTGNLDVHTATGIMDTVLALPASHQLSVVVATHNPAFSQRCDRILRVQGGQVIEEKPGTEVQ